MGNFDAEQSGKLNKNISFLKDLLEKHYPTDVIHVHRLSAQDNPIDPTQPCVVLDVEVSEEMSETENPKEYVSQRFDTMVDTILPKYGFVPDKIVQQAVQEEVIDSDESGYILLVEGKLALYWELGSLIEQGA